LRARAFGRAGRPADGLGSIEQAIEISGGDPLLYVMKGDLLVAQDDAVGAEDWYRRGFDDAAEAGTRMPKLRAAVGLCRARRERGGGEEARKMLRATYAEFTEGFSTPDLLAAAALLEDR
jgi:hypothetical protein